MRNIALVIKGEYFNFPVLKAGLVAIFKRGACAIQIRRELRGSEREDFGKLAVELRK